MKRQIAVVAAMAITSWLVAIPALAQHGQGGGAAKGPRSPVGGPPTSMGRSSSHSTHTNTAHGKSVNDLLTQNQKLSSRVSTLAGMPAQDACSGFKNLGQCVAAAHVSQNLGLQFACLKDKMLATTSTACTTSTASTSSTSSTKPMSLGKAIHELAPSVDANAEARRATRQARQDLNDTGS